ncbi:hypothetical protein [Mesorhizobium sp. WSM2561]|uniref:hypothetical protein n=1 Tax=Mesorhizobium sp. WSM2561 TaxID=1040985 RepID=UPI0018DB80AD|nr:hypothetical protein [Mesorhizobium sp. WSM2561]
MDTPSASAIVESLIFCASALRSPDDPELIHDLQRNRMPVSGSWSKQFKRGLMPPFRNKSKFFSQRIHLDVEGSAVAHAKPVLAMNDTKAAGDDDERRGH